MAVLERPSYLHRSFRIVSLLLPLFFAAVGSAAPAEPLENVRAWGNNESGQLGNGQGSWTVDSNVPVQVSGLTNARAVSGGTSHSLALTNVGRVWAWGKNDRGQLGNGTYVTSDVPVMVSNLAFVQAITSGSEQSCPLGRRCLGLGRKRLWSARHWGQR
ncbi:MAG: hypothetical protein KIT09_20015 [Bryobacteraceae bacterium]|nr:hypothetical protein [Bryobacteraceae bacterium]